MDFRDTWDSIANTLYPIFLAFLLSALLIWEKGIFDWIDLWDSNRTTILYSIFYIFMIFVYFVVDWMDANVVASFDRKVSRKDIFVWIFKLTILSVLMVFFIHSGRPLIFFVFVAYHLSQFISVLWRDKLADSEKKNLAWEKSEDGDYRKTLAVFQFRWLVMSVDFLACLYALIIITFNTIELNIDIIYIAIAVSLILNVLLKIFRHNVIFIPLYKHNTKNKTPKTST